MVYLIFMAIFDAFEKDLSKSPTLGRGKQGSKMDMMMMMMMMMMIYFCEKYLPCEYRKNKKHP